MKKKIILIISFISILFTSCKTQYAVTDLNKNFTTEQISDLNRITDFFKSEICLNNTNFKKCFKKIPNDQLRMEGKSICSEINYEKQQKLYTQISKSTFDEIWMFCEGTYNNVKIKSICSIYNGKYQNYLFDLGKSNPFIAKYAKNVERMGDFSWSDLKYWDIIKNEKYFDLNDPNMQLILAIHYLSLNDNLKRNADTIKKIE